jgi:hypothetical protein
MNEQLLELIARIDHPRVIEIQGTRAARLEALIRAAPSRP